MGNICLVLLRVKAPRWFVVSQAHRRCEQTSPRSSARNNNGWGSGSPFLLRADSQQGWDPLPTSRGCCRLQSCDGGSPAVWGGKGRRGTGGACCPSLPRAAWRKSSACPEMGQAARPRSGARRLPGLPQRACLEIGLLYQAKETRISLLGYFGWETCL